MSAMITSLSMLRGRTGTIILSLVAFGACQAEPPADASEAAVANTDRPSPSSIQRPTLDVEEVAKSLQGARGFSTASLPKKWQLSVTRSAHGDDRSVVVPEVPEGVRLRPGDECGFETADGADVSCEPGSHCMVLDDGSRRECVAGPHGRRSDG